MTPQNRHSSHRNLSSTIQLSIDRYNFKTNHLGLDLPLQCQVISMNLKGDALQLRGMFQGKYQLSGDVNGKPYWTSKGKVIWYGYNNWLIGDGKNAAIYSSSTQSFPYDKEIQWYIQGKNFSKKKFKPDEIDIKCKMKAGEPLILVYENLDILF